MAAKRVIVLVLVLFFFNFCYPASLHPLSQTLPMVQLQANTEYKGEQEHLKNGKSDGNITPHHGRKLQHAFGSRGGVTGGQAAGAGAGADGNGGGSHSNYPKGGAVIPVYAAGAANGHRNNHHHGAGSNIHLSVGPPILTTVLLAYFLLTNPFGF